MQPGVVIPLSIEKPAAGGRMIARVDGRVVLVAGAIPGERVSARVERMARGVTYAVVAQVDEPSRDRREPPADPGCGGCLYSHISYPRQLELKAEVIADAFLRIAHVALPQPVRVLGSREDGYRMRARLHRRGQRIGFFREGTHDICDARSTRQLLPETSDVLEAIGAGLNALGAIEIDAVELSENADASERVVMLEGPRGIDARVFGRLAGSSGLTGFAVSGGGAAPSGVAGDLAVTDVVSLGDRTIALRRHVAAFFQGNRYLLPELVQHVVRGIEPGMSVVDLYAGTGLFAVASAVARDAHVVAVEGDQAAAHDLLTNAGEAAGRVRPVHQTVEAFLTGPRRSADVVVVDPPRTGLTQDALAGVVRLGANRMIYVSCDPATLARDSRRLIDSGYEIARVDALDLFPNTPHVETVVGFERAGA